MALKEQDIVFTGQDTSGNTVIQMPITRAANVEDLTTTCLPLTGGSVTGNLTVQGKNVVRSVNGTAADTEGNVAINTVESVNGKSGAVTLRLTSLANVSAEKTTYDSTKLNWSYTLPFDARCTYSIQVGNYQGSSESKEYVYLQFSVNGTMIHNRTEKITGSISNSGTQIWHKGTVLLFNGWNAHDGYQRGSLTLEPVEIS